MFTGSTSNTPKTESHDLQVVWAARFYWISGLGGSPNDGLTQPHYRTFELCITLIIISSSISIIISVYVFVLLLLVLSVLLLLLL